MLDAGSCLISVFDIVVLFSIMKWLASKFALACFGKDSARWKAVVTADVGAHAKGLLVSKERGGSGTVGDVENEGVGRKEGGNGKEEESSAVYIGNTATST